MAPLWRCAPLRVFCVPEFVIVPLRQMARQLCWFSTSTVNVRVRPMKTVPGDVSTASRSSVL